MSENMNKTAKNRETRKAFYEDFKKKFDSKTCFAIAQTELIEKELIKKEQFKDDYEYIQFLTSADSFENLFYAFFSTSSIVFKIDNKIFDMFFFERDDMNDDEKKRVSEIRAITSLEECWKVRKIPKDDFKETAYKKHLTTEEKAKYNDSVARARLRVQSLVYLKKDNKTVKNAVMIAKYIRDCYKAQSSIAKK